MKLGITSKNSYRDVLEKIRTRRSTRALSKPPPNEWEYLASEIALEGPLGEGPFASVYSCKLLGERVVVKVFKSASPRYSPLTHFPTLSAADIENAIDQGTISKWLQLDHPHVLPFIGCCLTSETPMIFTPYAINGTARKYRASHPEVDWLLLLCQVASGLEYLHVKAKLVHGDLRGNNILIDGTGLPQITDYGLTTMTQNPCGRPNQSCAAQWMAPEVLRDGPLTYASDVYSLGMTMYELWFNKNPFDLMEHGLVEEMLLDAHVLPTLETTPAMPEALWKLLQASWDRSAEDRPSAESMYESVCTLYSQV